MLDGAIDEEVTKPPTHLQVVECCLSSIRELEGTIVCNSWLNGMFSYFPTTTKETMDVDESEDNEEPEYIGVAPQDGNEYTLVIDSDTNNNDNDVIDEEEVFLINVVIVTVIIICVIVVAYVCCVLQHIHNIR